MRMIGMILGYDYYFSYYLNSNRKLQNVLEQTNRLKENTCFSYLPFVGAESNSKIWHCSQYGNQWLDCVAEHHGPVLFEVFWRETALVNNSENTQVC